MIPKMLDAYIPPLNFVSQICCKCFTVNRGNIQWSDQIFVFYDQILVSENAEVIYAALVTIFFI